MGRDDSNYSVEFVVPEPDDSAGEELVHPAGFPRLRRARLPLFVAGAVGLIALIAVNVANGPSGSPSAAPVTVTAGPTSPEPAPSTPSNGNSVTFALRSGYIAVLHPASGRRATARIEVLPADVTCPSGASCAVLFRTSKSVAAAVHRALPKATELQTVTTTEHEDLPGSQLLLRRITGRIGVARLSVKVAPVQAGAHVLIGWNATEDAKRTLVSATDDVAGQTVSVRVTAPPGYNIDIAAVRRLAADSRLARLA